MYVTTRLVENRPLGRGNFVLRLALPDAHAQALAGAKPGQFVMLRGEWGRDPLLPRAFSILRLSDGGCEILVKAIGRGTRLLQLAATGAPLSLLGPLGRPFPPLPDGRGDWLVAGGVGLAPLLWYAEEYRSAGTHQLVYGARSAADLVLLDEIERAGARIILTTEDGSAPRGRAVVRGRVTDALADLLPRDAVGARVLTCGPNAMMRAVVEMARTHSLPCLVSVEGEMACGIGACLGCALPLLDGSKPFAYACTDGPVFDAARVVIP
jgi:dihydroorotate dehydrogenase electron transfer subunit